MPDEIVMKLKAIKGELETVRDNLNEDDFSDSYYFTDCYNGLCGAISKLDTALLNREMNKFTVDSYVVYDGVEYVVEDFRFNNNTGGYTYDLYELNGDGIMDDIPEDEITELED